MNPLSARLCIATIIATIASVGAFNASPANAVGATSAICTNLFTDNAHFSGIGIAIPTQGTCFLTPLRQARLSVTGTLSGT